MASDGAGVTRIGQYMLCSTIGKGSFGKVKKAQHVVTDHVVAVKIINRKKIKRQDMLDKIKREIQILKLFRHPHIIKLYQVVTSPSDIFMLMEYVSGGELFNYILKKGRLSEKESRRFFQQIISGVEYCHRHQVVHRDLKPENLLLDENLNVKIADFGLSNVMTDGDFLKTSCGSPNYASPQVISGQLYAGPEVDVWSCGVILYVLLCGRLPFDDEHLPTLFKLIRRGVFSFPSHVSEDAKDLVSRMLIVDPLKRITIDQIRQHTWFLVDLPEDLFEDTTLDDSAFDADVVAKVCKKFHVFEDPVLDALRRNGPDDQIVIAYKLMMDNKRHNVPEESALSHMFEGNAPGRTVPIKIDTLEMSNDGSRKDLIVPAPLVRPANTHRWVKRSRWHLGMRSKNRPGDIMAEVYRALEALNFQWKVVHPYHIRCRSWNQVSGTMMKMSLQLFEAEGQFLLDFRNLPTSDADRLHLIDQDDEDVHTSACFHTMEFFELCTMVIAELGK
eukprot:TRINITY_DN10867_c0_g1_i2.p1 TRINITY_DN10867_c0_g1~~TRINITY_DN10867_c0_g1_i2.p1  ORF type:complete len:502 (+),score=108.01 TRINITY_DN10867_c0_g1_i2:96-1601(+)